MSRCIFVTVPEERSSEVVGVLQQRLHVSNVVRHTQDGVSTIRCFCSATTAGFVIHHLDKIGVGVAYGEIALMPVPVLLPKRRNTRLREIVRKVDKQLDSKQRLAVEEVYASVVSNAELSFEFLAFIVCAAIIAAIGLGTDNDIMIVASMLVSPLMGPILAFTLATNLQDWRLFRQAVMVEVIGILVTFLVGFVMGLLASINNKIPNLWEWPTTQMSSRGEDTNLILGLLYAIPSGVAVALASTNPNAGALVGVAIAASLLPPITNSGICFAYAAAGNPDHETQNFAAIAGESFALFAINVVCIYVAGVITFALKRVQRMARPRLSTYKSLNALPVPAVSQLSIDLQSERGGPSSPAMLKWQRGAVLAQQSSVALDDPARLSGGTSSPDSSEPPVDEEVPHTIPL